MIVKPENPAQDRLSLSRIVGGSLAHAVHLFHLLLQYAYSFLARKNFALTCSLALRAKRKKKIRLLSFERSACLLGFQQLVLKSNVLFFFPKIF